MKRIEKVYLILGFFLLLARCSEPLPRQLSDQENDTPTRWYNNEQVLVGAQVFAEHCAVSVSYTHLTLPTICSV